MWFCVNGEISLMFETHFSAAIVIEYIRNWRSVGEVEQTTSQWHNVWQICGSAIKNNFVSSFSAFSGPHFSGWRKILCTFVSHIHSSTNAKRLNGRYDPGGFKGFPLFSRFRSEIRSDALSFSVHATAHHTALAIKGCHENLFKLIFQFMILFTNGILGKSSARWIYVYGRDQLNYYSWILVHPKPNKCFSIFHY